MIVANRLQTVEEYYFSKKLREVRSMISEGKDVINIGIGSPDFEPLPEVIQALCDATKDAQAHQYQSYQGIPELRQAMQQFYQNRYGAILDSNTEILPLMGSKEGVMHISLAFLNKGDEVLIPNPGYPTYTSVTKLVEATPKYYDLTAETNWLPDLKSLEKTDLSKVKLMWVNYPHMPTGANGNLEFYRELIEFAKRNDILLINDNPYSFVLNDNPLSLLQIEGAKEVVLELNSLSKTFNMSGWRIGMVMGNEEHINAVLKVKSNMDSGMFYPLQKGAVKALQSSEEWYQYLNELYGKRRIKVYELTKLLGCEYDENAVGMFVWAKLPDEVISATDFIDEILQKHHIFITPGEIFGSNGERYIRFSLCVSEERIEEAIRRIKEANN